MPIAFDNNEDGLVTASPIAEKPTPVTTLKIAEPNYKDVAIDTKWTPISSIVSHISGASWTVDYYAQVIDTDTQLMSQAPTVSGVYQQYKLIKELELRVTNPLTEQQDAETKMMQIDGAALVYAAVIPNEGDMFTADIGVGKKAVFRVSSSKKNSIFKEATYEIEYSFSSTSSEYIEDLEAKTVEELVFRKDFITRGLNPVLLEEDAVSIAQLQGKCAALVEQYYRAFFNPEYATFTLPLQQYSTYDPFLTKTLKGLYGVEDSVLSLKLRELNLGDDPACKQFNFWDALVNQDLSLIRKGFTRVGLVDTNQFTRMPYYQGIRWSGIVQCVYPSNARMGIGGVGLNANKALSMSDFQNITPPQFYAEVHELSNQANQNYNVIFPASTAATASLLPKNADGSVYFDPVTTDDYYVLSKKFYDQAEDMNMLEQLVSDYINKKSIDPVQLSKTMDICGVWGMLEQFYYIPVLLIITRGYILNFQG